MLEHLTSELGLNHSIHLPGEKCLLKEGVLGDERESRCEGEGEEPRQREEERLTYGNKGRWEENHLCPGGCWGHQHFGLAAPTPAPSPALASGRYSVEGFIDKNRDFLFQDFKRLLYNR